MNYDTELRELYGEWAEFDYDLHERWVRYYRETDEHDRGACVCSGYLRDPSRLVYGCRAFAGRLFRDLDLEGTRGSAEQCAALDLEGTRGSAEQCAALERT